MSALLFVALIGLRPAPLQKPAELPFAKEIAAFKEADRKNPPAKGQILFIGSSTFTIWHDVQEYFPKHRILNRAFGGSQLTDVTRYVNDIVFPYRPKQIVIYCGENDVAGDPRLPAYKVAERFERLYSSIRAKLPNVPMLYVSMKPSPSRWQYRAKMIAANGWIRDFCARQKNTDYLDMWPSMLDASGRPRQELFTKDDLHMNAAGYRVWAPAIEPHLK